MIIKIPKKLIPTNAIAFSRQIFLYGQEEEYIYDFGEMQHCHPFGLLLVANAIRSNIHRYPNACHTPINTQNTQGGQFAASFGFYTSMGFNIGERKEESEVGDGYIPIKLISRAELDSRYSNKNLLNDKIVCHAEGLADMLVHDKSKEVRSALQYCFREIIRNTFEHGKTNNIWVCGQYWPTREEAEIALLDEGIGIFKSLKSNPTITVNTDREANQLALQPGLSRTLGQKQDQYDMWQNSGYGLYVASTLCAMSGGYFLLDSGDSCILVNSEKTIYYQGQIKGTAIGFNIKTDSVQLQRFDQTLKLIVEEGESKAKENGRARILSASKVTTIASMIRHIENSAERQVLCRIEEAKVGGVPINTEVKFLPKNVNRKGEILGTFEYDNRIYEGILLNVDAVNRKL